MTARLGKARRIMALQAQLNAIAKWRLLDHQSEAAVLDDLQKGLLRFLQEESAYSGIFSASMLRRLESLAAARAAAEIAQIAQRTICLEESSRLRRAGRIVEKLAINARREEASKALAEAIETRTQHMAQGSCKLTGSSSGKREQMRGISGVDNPGFGYCPGRCQGG
ncbi:MAG: hypothetical protein L0Y57_06580 [Beijerinckiaceae bacterium]|nr:hypothetical protein [Beijerinckiaceae bacterium]